MARNKGMFKTGGRQSGTPNKITNDVRECIKSFINGNIASLQPEYDKMEAKDKLRFLVDLLPYIVPKLQSTFEDTDNEVNINVVYKKVTPKTWIEEE